MSVISITPLLDEKTDKIVYITTISSDDDHYVINNDNIRLPDDIDDIKFMPYDIPYKILPKLTEKGKILLELNIEQYRDLKYKLSTYPIN